MALGIIGASQMAVALVNLLTNVLVGPRLLPRLDFSKGIPSDQPHHGGHPHAPDQSAGRHRPAGRPGDPLPGQPRPEPVFRAAHRLPRCARADAARRRGPAAAGARRHPVLECAVQPRGRDRLSSVPPAARLESARAALDGLRTQARQAGAVQRAAARRSARAVLRDHRRSGDPAHHPVRHHAGHRYRTCRAMPPASSSARWRIR